MFVAEVGIAAVREVGGRAGASGDRDFGVVGRAPPAEDVDEPGRGKRRPGSGGG